MRWLVPALVVALFVLSGCTETPEQSDAKRVAKAGAKSGGGAEAPPALEAVPLPAKVNWESFADAQFPRAEHCVANVEETFYIVGGFIVPHPVSGPGPSGAVGVIVPTASVEIYNAESDSWSAGPNYPSTLDHCMAVGYDGWVYVFHGSGNNKIKPGDDSWTSFPAMPHAHGATGVAEEIDGKIYVAGGGGGAAFVDVYDPATNQWSTIEAPILQPVSHVAGAALNGKLYAIGGDIRGHSNNSNATQEFDPVTQTWQNRSALPVVRGSLFAQAWMGHIIVMGGQNGATNVASFSDVHAYNPITDTWTKLPDMTNPRHGFGGGVYNDKLYVFSGAPQQGVSGAAKADALVAG